LSDLQTFYATLSYRLIDISGNPDVEPVSGVERQFANVYRQKSPQFGVGQPDSGVRRATAATAERRAP